MKMFKIQVYCIIIHVTEAKKKQEHLYGEIEFIEKIYKDFENEQKSIFYLAGIKEILRDISVLIIRL